MKEELLNKLDNLTDYYGFKFESVHRLNKDEIEFLVKILSKTILHEKALLLVCGGSPDKVEDLIQRVLKEEKKHEEKGDED